MHFVDAKGILTGGEGHYGMNIYRGCSHGCIYCDSRSRCYQFTHAFEDIEVKQNAPVLLDQALKSKRQKCMIGTGSMSDPYMHCEEKLGLTRMYSWGDIVSAINGVPLVGITAISYGDSQDVQNNYGAGRHPVSRSKGRITPSAKITLHQSEVIALQSQSPTGRLQDIAPLTLP